MTVKNLIAARTVAQTFSAAMILMVAAFVGVTSAAAQQYAMSPYAAYAAAPYVTTPQASATTPTYYIQPVQAQRAYAQPTYVQPTYAQPTHAQPTYSAPNRIVESSVIAQAGTQIVIGLHGPNTQAVCQAGANGVGYFNCQQIASYDLHTQTGHQSTTTETQTGNAPVATAQPRGSFFGATAYHKEHQGESSSYCQANNTYAANAVCVVHAQAGYNGAWAKVHFKRSQD